MSGQLRVYSTSIGIVWAMLFIVSTSNGGKDHLQNIWYQLYLYMADHLRTLHPICILCL